MPRQDPEYPLAPDSELSLWLAVDSTVDVDALRADGQSEDDIVQIYHPHRLELIRGGGRDTWAEQVSFAGWMAWRAEHWLAHGVDPTGGRTPSRAVSSDETDRSGSTAGHETPEPTIPYPCWLFGRPHAIGIKDLDTGEWNRDWALARDALLRATTSAPLQGDALVATDGTRRWWRAYGKLVELAARTPGVRCPGVEALYNSAIDRWSRLGGYLESPPDDDPRTLTFAMLQFLDAERLLRALRIAYWDAEVGGRHPCDESWAAIVRHARALGQSDVILLQKLPLEDQRAWVLTSLAGRLTTGISLGRAKRLDAALHELHERDGSMPHRRVHYLTLMGLVRSGLPVAAGQRSSGEADRRLLNRLTNDIIHRAPSRARVEMAGRGSRERDEPAVPSLRRTVRLQDDLLEQLASATTASVDPLEEFAAREDAEHLLEQLPPRQRKVFRLHEEGFSHREISRMLGITVGGSKANLHKAVRRLRALAS
jgi:RNA polymerase sigma factor (sigma-70 family)